MEEKIIPVARAVPIEQIWAAKDEALVIFGYRNHESTFKKLWIKFKNDKKYRDGYRASTYGVPTVNIKKFDEFLDCEDKNKFKKR